MTLLSLLITFGIIWLNLTGLSLLANYAIKDYAVSRIGAPLLLCLVFFFIEHFYGLGPQLWLLPFSAAISGWLVWKERRMLRQNIEVEAYRDPGRGGARPCEGCRGLLSDGLVWRRGLRRS